MKRLKNFIAFETKQEFYLNILILKFYNNLA